MTMMMALKKHFISNQTLISSTRFFSKSAPQYIDDFHKLLVTRTLNLKKLGIPVKHRKLILKYTHKYRLGLWRPRADTLKA
ncbi:hypothetical protein MKW92_025645 [Papaver armeniacum]|nr:hypothetical protein MKW92_025645 [Papaver armeniacum]